VPPRTLDLNPRSLGKIDERRAFIEMNGVDPEEVTQGEIGKHVGDGVVVPPTFGGYHAKGLKHPEV
jgi:hypothetical protein